ncbi:protein zer-1 homolog isoform X2 [Maniola jurtina]|uniref:protein zer-1 homolog isoform X2 n=1 Tax=Maniola jurtina TaxID=191418 RepID=UPI001E687BF2|nr:protein zer-1 homolog isoform X2 [Maniola jurtina]
MSARKISILYDNSPDSLLDLALECFIDNLSIYTKWDREWDCWAFKEGIILPAEICERFLKVYQQKDRVDNRLVGLFRDQSRTRLENLHLRNATISTESFRYLLLEHDFIRMELLHYISGTNLAGTGSAIPALNEEGAPDLTESAQVAQVRCDIPGLESRVNNPLEFLGLYGTHHGACQRHDIPAKVISGDSNEEQLLIAAEVFIERPAMLSRVLNDLYYKFRITERYNDYASRTLSVVIDAMEQHVTEKHIQIPCSAILFYIMKGTEKNRIGVKLKKRIIISLLNGMEAYLEDETLMRNGCLTLCQFKIPSDMLFAYERVVSLLLNGVANVANDGFVQRIAIYLLNSLACHVDGQQKRLLGHHDAIEKMLHLIADRLDRRLCDDVLEVAWSTMWNVTDETPQNCRRFLENHGMQYFLDCLRKFPDKEELLRNMMGLLGNVAEVVELRPRLMNTLFLNVFNELLDSSSDGIEVSYNAAGVLAHIASDGPEAWTVDEPSRDVVLERLAAAVERWDRRAERNINYRSFEPILTLLHAYHTPQCQHWAVWALANLTTVYPSKYCSLVEAEGGIEILYALLRHRAPYQRIKKLAMIVINNCEAFSNVLPEEQVVMSLLNK